MVLCQQEQGLLYTTGQTDTLNCRISRKIRRGEKFQFLWRNVPDSPISFLQPPTVISPV